jgi:hypothetical protein
LQTKKKKVRRERRWTEEEDQRLEELNQTRKKTDVNWSMITVNFNQDKEDADKRTENALMGRQRLVKKKTNTMC